MSTLTADCVFSVATHGVRLTERSEIADMFERLWRSHSSVRHYAFQHVPSPATRCIASRFSVENIELDGTATHKSNCNFFTMQDRKFSEVTVYMAGENTLTKAP